MSSTTPERELARRNNRLGLAIGALVLFMMAMSYFDRANLTTILFKH